MILITGGSGTGKTTFVMQSLFHGARKGEKGLYISGMSEPVFMIKKFMSGYEFYEERFIGEGLIEFRDLGTVLSAEFPERSLGEIYRLVRETKPARVVIDPLPLSHAFSNAIEYRKYLFNIFTTLKKLDTFTLAVGERPETNVEEIVNYMADGIVSLSFQPIDGLLRYRNLLHLKKMRGTDHAKDVLALEISSQGIAVFRIE